MEVKKHWQFPVPSTCLNTDVHFIHKAADALILFDYYDQEDVEYYNKHGRYKIFNGGILFDTTLGCKYTSEKFLKSLNDSYDTLIEYKNSEWIEEFSKTNIECAKRWNIRHFAIFFDGYGLYEIIAKDFKILETKEGPLAT